MREVYVASGPPEAHLVSALLEDAGIRAAILGESLFGSIPVAAMAPSIWVDEADFEQAEAVVAEFRRRQGLAVSTGSPWLCQGCGEVVEAQFEQCWKCGASRLLEDEASVAPARGIG